jgi:DNA adenine methylase
VKSNPLKWHGGKQYLADRIIELMPPHKHYVEPFFGGGAVLFRKPCEGVSEVINDRYLELINFWRVLSLPASFAMFQRRIEATPFSQIYFNVAKLAKEISFTGDGTPEENSVAAAVGFFIRYRQSRQGLGKGFATLSRNRTRRGMNEQVSSWLTAIEGLPEAHARLKRVVILNEKAYRVIEKQDGPNTLFYCDPPYLHETRVTTGDYECEMNEAEHALLLLTLTGVKGKFMISGYRSEMYDQWADTFGYRRVDIEIASHASSKEEKEIKTECLWLNY